MQFGFIMAFIVVILEHLFKPGYSQRIRKSIHEGNTPILTAIMCGVINYGLPSSLMALAQRTLTTTTCTVASPTIAFFSLFFSAFYLPDENISRVKLCQQLLATLGCLFTIEPSLEQPMIHWIDVCYMMLSHSITGFGSVYLRKFLQKADPALSCLLQLFGSMIFTFTFTTLTIGFPNHILNPQIKWPAILGICYTYSATFLYQYVIHTMGPVKANFTSYGQVLVSELAGVVFFHEWDRYMPHDVLISVFGLTLLTGSIYWCLCTTNSFERSVEGDQVLLLVSA